MADPKQLRILKKLVAHLEGINPDNVDPATGDPYEIDLRGRVYRGRSILTVRDALDCLSILEFPRQEITVPVDGTPIRQDAWSLMLQGWPQDDMANPSDPAYRLKAMCEQRLSQIMAEKPNGRGPAYPGVYRLGDDIASFTIAPGVVRPPEDANSRLAMFYMPLVVGVVMNVSDPY